jgi:hypothetical protein
VFLVVDLAPLDALAFLLEPVVLGSSRAAVLAALSLVVVLVLLGADAVTLLEVRRRLALGDAASTLDVVLQLSSADDIIRFVRICKVLPRRIYTCTHGRPTWHRRHSEACSRSSHRSTIATS